MKKRPLRKQIASAVGTGLFVGVPIVGTTWQLGLLSIKMNAIGKLAEMWGVIAIAILAVVGFLGFCCILFKYGDDVPRRPSKIIGKSLEECADCISDECLRAMFKLFNERFRQIRRWGRIDPAADGAKVLIAILWKNIGEMSGVFLKLEERKEVHSDVIMETAVKCAATSLEIVEVLIRRKARMKTSTDIVEVFKRREALMKTSTKCSGKGGLDGDV